MAPEALPRDGAGQQHHARRGGVLPELRSADVCPVRGEPRVPRVARRVVDRRGDRARVERAL